MHAGSRQTGQLQPLTNTVSGRGVLYLEFEAGEPKLLRQEG